MKTWIQNGHVLDPLTGTDQVCDVLVDGERIKKVGTREKYRDALKVRMCRCWMLPAAT